MKKVFLGSLILLILVGILFGLWWIVVQGNYAAVASRLGFGDASDSTVIEVVPATGDVADDSQANADTSAGSAQEGDVLSALDVPECQALLVQLENDPVVPLGETEKLRVEMAAETDVAIAAEFCKSMQGDFAPEVTDGTVGEASVTSLLEVQSAITATATEMAVCLQADGRVSEPATGKKICEETGTEVWPDIAALGHAWGGCDFSVDRSVIDVADSEKSLFQYCATFDDGSIWQCTDAGCVTVS